MTPVPGPAAHDGRKEGHAEELCPNCRECEGCDGGSGADPVHTMIVCYPGGTVIGIRCADCGGVGLLCDCGCHEADR